MSVHDNLGLLTGQTAITNWVIFQKIAKIIYNIYCIYMRMDLKACRSYVCMFVDSSCIC